MGQHRSYLDDSYWFLLDRQGRAGYWHMPLTYSLLVWAAGDMIASRTLMTTHIY